MTVGCLYGAGAETLIFVTGTSGKYPKLFASRQKNQNQLWMPRKPRKIGVWVSGAEIQTSAVDTRTAVWVSTPEKISKIVLGKTRNFSRKFRGVSAPALYKNPAVRTPTQNLLERPTFKFSVPKKEGGQQQEFDNLLSCSVTFWSLFSDASVTFFVTFFAQIPFAGLLLRQGDKCFQGITRGIHKFAK